MRPRRTHEERPSPDHQVSQSKVRGEIERDGLQLAARGVVQFLEVEDLEDLLRSEPSADGKGTDTSNQQDKR
jgi:hypothetical protein